jgi:hypothetical protein
MTPTGKSRPVSGTDEHTKGMSFEQVRRLAAALPGVVDGTSYGTPALKVGKTLIARLKEDRQTLVLKMDITSRDLLLRSRAPAFHLTDHYRDYPWVLVHLGVVTPAQMTELLEDAWRLGAPQKLIAAFDERRSSGRPKPKR